MLTEIFYTFLITASSALILKLSSLCFKSKCKEINLCCIKIVRDTQTEEKEMEFLTLHKSHNNSPTSDDGKKSDTTI